MIRQQYWINTISGNYPFLNVDEQGYKTVAFTIGKFVSMVIIIAVIFISVAKYFTVKK